MDNAAAVAALSRLSEVAQAPFERLQRTLPATVRPTGPSYDDFTIDAHDDSGAAIAVTATREDGRQVAWIVEIFVHPAAPGTWNAIVKAEIDLDDRDGDDRCVLNEQQTVTDSEGVIPAIGNAVTIVTSYPATDLLTDGWEPADWNTD